MICRHALDRHQVHGGGNDLKSARMCGARGAQQITVEPGAGFKQIQKREFRTQAKLKGYVPKLHVKIDQAGFPASRGFALHEADCKLAHKRRRADAANALDHADKLACACRGDALAFCQLFFEERQRAFQLIQDHR